MVLKTIYTLLIALFFAVFVGVGISAFYPGPKHPEYPERIKPDIVALEESKDPAEVALYKEELAKYEREQKEYQQASNIYDRNVSIISAICSIIVVTASLTLFKTLLLISDGLLLGGLFTMVYSVIRGFGAEDNMFRFIVVSIGLAISLILGYIKFARPEKSNSK